MLARQPCYLAHIIPRYVATLVPDGESWLVSRLQPATCCSFTSCFLSRGSKFGLFQLSLSLSHPLRKRLCMTVHLPASPEQGEILMRPLIIRHHGLSHDRKHRKSKWKRKKCNECRWKETHHVKVSCGVTCWAHAKRCVFQPFLTSRINFYIKKHQCRAIRQKYDEIISHFSWIMTT